MGTGKYWPQTSVNQWVAGSSPAGGANKAQNIKGLQPCSPFLLSGFYRWVTCWVTIDFRFVKLSIVELITALKLNASAAPLSISRFIALRGQ
jgi:hypothetical protein